MIRRPLTALLMNRRPERLPVGGCRAGEAHPPDPPPSGAPSTGPASPAEQMWWRNFHDSQLNAYVDQALRNNSDVLIARERINEYQARVYASEGRPVSDPGCRFECRSHPVPVCRHRFTRLRRAVQRQPDGQL
ncbi:multidrug resistance outer membrane protein MdtQ [Leclercia adecarboxylata]|uniref:Multidrug resistance outer membrane protein MdtQ n=1 Tax=Leclercia adecarboxylata TaxID=83655 RepID=A0A4U9HWG4_9ENTR|nr:multidrug resistance outer membrane protein MdtQ [Leclercia adecarboxylata]